MGRKAKTRKEQTQRRGRRGKKTQYRVRNWREYNESLVQRGSLTLWISEDVLESWKPEPAAKRERGRPPSYSDGAIVCLLTLRAVLCLPLRATEGLARSLMTLLGVEVDVPDYTTLSRRGKTLRVDLPVSARQGSLTLVIDSTGLKVYGEGEWKARKHGYSKRRTWRKLHLSVNLDTLEIEAVNLTGAGGGDARAGCEMIETIEQEITCVIGDGAYDTHQFYDTCEQQAIAEVIVPPRRTAPIWQHGNSALPPLPRDEHLRAIRRKGRKRWKEEAGYHRRSLAETTVFRFKTLFGGQLMARHPDSQFVEVRIKCRALNMMTQLGMPDSVPMS